MKLLILFIAMGVIGVIGTVEYIQAQTPPPLTISPTNIPDERSGSIGISHHASLKYYILPSNQTIRNAVEPYIGNIHIPSLNKFDTNPLFPTRNQHGAICNGNLYSVKTLLNTEDNVVPNLVAPDNITPTGINNIHAIGLDFWNNTSNRNIQCSIDVEAQTDGTTPILTTKELRVTITSKHDKKPYYFSPRDNITQAQPIPLCTTTNFDTTDITLKGTNQMCYGKFGNDMVIITKRFLGFYGTADTVSTPTKTVDFNPTPAQPDNTPANNNDDNNNDDEISEQEKAYRELLKKLYLPAV